MTQIRVNFCQKVIEIIGANNHNSFLSVQYRADSVPLGL